MSTLVRGGTLLAAAAIAGLLSGCGTGQITQTDSQRSSISGVNANSADGKIALRDVQLAYAFEYEPGSAVPLSVRIFNNTFQPARLTSVTSDRGSVVLVGAAPSASPSPSSASPSPSPSPNGSGTRRATASPTASASPSPSPSSASPSPSVAGSTKIDVTIPPASFVILATGASSYLAIASLTGGPLMVSESATFTFTFSFTNGDGKPTTVSDLAVPVAVPASAVPRTSE
jgi:hypothetical protein